MVVSVQVGMGGALAQEEAELLIVVVVVGGVSAALAVETKGAVVALVPRTFEAVERHRWTAFQVHFVQYCWLDWPNSRGEEH